MESDWPRTTNEWSAHVRLWNHARLMEWQERKDREHGEQAG